MRVISLEENYRSSQKLLDASHKMIEENYDGEDLRELRVRLRSKRGAHPIKLVSAPNTETEEAFLISKMLELASSKKDKSVAIIVRKNSDVSKLLSLLEENGVEAAAERGANIFAHPVGMLFLSLMEFLYDPRRRKIVCPEKKFDIKIKR
jgi:superfamily I DNA/RNA helicase